jgi:uncharacterized protein
MDYTGVKDYMLAKLEREIPEEFSYHSLEHTLDVLKVTEELCNQEAVSAKDAILLKTAALFHDAGFIISMENHEQFGCDLAWGILPRFEYPRESIQQITQMIQATKVPQSPQNKLEAILCDADLDYLGREDFHKTGRRLFDELRTLGRVQDEEEWNRMQVDFLEKHRYFTPTNIRRRTWKKNEHLRLLREIVDIRKKNSESKAAFKPPHS